MKRLLLCLLVLFSILFTTSASAEKLNLLVFGDSLSAGHKIKKKDSFAAQLENALIQKGYPIHVINYSVSGATTADGLKRLKGALAKKPSAVILELGANDMLQRLDLSKTKQNLQTLITAFEQKDIPVFLAGMEASLTLPNEYRDNFRKMYSDLSLNNEVLLYPFFMKGLWNDDGTPVAEDYFLPDHMHPTPAGVDVMVKNILPFVEQFIREDVADLTIKK